MEKIDTKKVSGFVQDLLIRCRSAFAYVWFFSLFVNLLMLTVPLYMLQIFDRVIPSQSHATLVYLTVIAMFALCILFLLDMCRQRIMMSVSEWLDRQISADALGRSIDNQLQGGNYARSALVDVNMLRRFLSGGNVYAFFDAPWIVIYLLVIYFLSVTLGVIATIGAAILLALAWLNEYVTRHSTQQASALNGECQLVANDAIKNAEVVQAMGMQPGIMAQWQQGNNQYLEVQGAIDRRVAFISNIAKTIRMILQVFMLGTGACFIINGDMTPGAMIAASIIVARGLAPIEQAISGWKAFLATYNAFQRLQQYFATPKLRVASSDTVKPTGVLTVKELSFALKENMPPILHNVSFNLSAGKSLAVIGPGGAGKSTLLRLLVGVWAPSYGSIRLDNVEVFDWNEDALQQHVGYLAQQPYLFKNTIKENIARMQPVSEDLVVAAAEFINIHQTILHLKNTYNTEIQNYNLPAGLHQRIALARAFYGMPGFVVLDEPETYLDQDGMVSLQESLAKARAQQITVVFVTQRPELAKQADMALVLRDGKQQDFGPAAEVLQRWRGQ